MMTPAILNPIGSPPAAAPASRQNAGGAPFGEVLSRQISKKDALDAAGKRQPAEGGKADAAGKPGKTNEWDTREDHVEAASASAELLMLVTNLSGAEVQPTAAAVTAGAAAAVAALPVELRPEPSAADPATTLITPATAAALPAHEPATALPAPAIAAASGLARQADEPAPVTPSIPGSTPKLTNNTVSDSGHRSAPATPFQPALSSAAPALSDTATPAESTTVSPPVSAVRSSASEPDVQLAASNQPAAVPPAVPQAAMNTAPAANVPQADRIGPQVGASGWDQAVGQKVVWMAAGAQSSASLTLNPPDLGPLQVALSVVNNQATISFTAAQPEVRQALEAALPKLREMLDDAGIRMGQTSVNAGTQQQHGGHADTHQLSRSSVPSGSVVEAPLPIMRGQQAGGTQGLVDTFA